jgi:hypothetical protein
MCWWPPRLPGRAWRAGHAGRPGRAPLHRPAACRTGREWSMRRGAETAMPVALSARCSINNSAAVLAAVEAGGGIGMMSDFAARAALDAGRCAGAGRLGGGATSTRGDPRGLPARAPSCAEDTGLYRLPGRRINGANPGIMLTLRNAPSRAIRTRPCPSKSASISTPAPSTWCRPTAQKIDLNLRKDSHADIHQWFHFRLQGARGQAARSAS